MGGSNMKIMRSEVITIIAVILLLVSIFCCVLPRVVATVWNDGIEQAAKRVNREPTLTGLAGYIADEIHVGMSQSETEEKLKALAPITVIPRHTLQDVGSGYGPTSCDEIQLKFTSLPGHIWPMMACYDAQGGLVILHSVDAESFPPLDIYAPINPEGELFRPF